MAHIIISIFEFFEFTWVTKSIYIYQDVFQSVTSFFPTTWWQACYYIACSKAADPREREREIRSRAPGAREHCAGLEWPQTTIFELGTAIFNLGTAIFEFGPGSDNDIRAWDASDNDFRAWDGLNDFRAWDGLNDFRAWDGLRQRFSSLERRFSSLGRRFSSLGR